MIYLCMTRHKLLVTRPKLLVTRHKRDLCTYIHIANSFLPSGLAGSLETDYMSLMRLVSLGISSLCSDTVSSCLLSLDSLGSNSMRAHLLIPDSNSSCLLSLPQ